MERPPKIQQRYADSVCLTAVITVLMTLPGTLDAFAQRRAPLRAQQFVGESGIMAETFETLTESQARDRYELKRADRTLALAAAAGAHG